MPKFEIRVGDWGVRDRGADQALGVVFRIKPDIGAEFAVYARLSGTLAAVWGYPKSTPEKELQGIFLVRALQELKTRLHGFTPPEKYDPRFAFNVDLHTANCPGPKPEPEKICQFQERGMTGLVCAVGCEGDKYKGNTTAALCAACELPDDRVRCLHLMHPQVAIADDFSPKRVYGALCNIGKTDVDWSGCRPDGHDCWRQTYIGGGIASVLAAAQPPKAMPGLPMPAPAAMSATSAESDDIALLRRLLAQRESEVVELKPPKAKDEEIRKTIIAFANDFNENKEGFLIIGADDRGGIIGIEGDLDAFQRRVVDIARDQCSPSVMVSIKSIPVDDKKVVLVRVKQSPMRPHSSGDMFVRIGPVTRRADDHEILHVRQLANSKFASLSRLVRAGEGMVTVTPSSKSTNGALCQIEKVSEHYVTLRNCSSDSYHSVPLERIHISRDEKQYRPKLHIYPESPLETF